MEHRHGDLSSFTTDIFHIDAFICFKAHAESGRYVSGLCFAVCHCNGLNKYTGTGTAILRPNAVAVADHDLVVTIHIGSYDLGDLIGVCFCGFGSLAEKRDALRVVDLGERDSGSGSSIADNFELPAFEFFNAVKSGCCGPCSCNQSFFARIGGVCISAASTLEHSDACAHLALVTRILNGAVNHIYGVRFGILHVQLRKISARPQCFFKNGLCYLFAYQIYTSKAYCIISITHFFPAVKIHIPIFAADIPFVKKDMLKY